MERSTPEVPLDDTWRAAYRVQDGVATQVEQSAADDAEGELGVVIGRTASRVSAADALRHVAGYTYGLDMIMRGGEDPSVRTPVT